MPPPPTLAPPSPSSARGKQRRESPPAYGEELPPLFKLRPRFELLKKIGHGAHADVYAAVDRLTQRKLAVKEIRKGRKGAGPAQREFLFGRKANHPHIVRVRDCIDTGNHVYLLFDLAEQGDLFDRLDPSRGTVTFGQARTWMFQVASALMHLHSQGIVHRDIKPENVLLHKGSALLCDLGLASPAGHVSSGSAPGTAAYMAPEVISRSSDKTSRHTVGTEQDVWSFGVLMYATLFSDLPWETALSDDPDYSQFVHDGGVNPEVHPFDMLSPQLARLLGRLLAPNPAHRCSMREAVDFLKSDQPWFNSRCATPATSHNASAKASRHGSSAAAPVSSTSARPDTAGSSSAATNGTGTGTSAGSSAASSRTAGHQRDHHHSQPHQYSWQRRSSRGSASTMSAASVRSDSLTPDAC